MRNYGTMKAVALCAILALVLSPVAAQEKAPAKDKRNITIDDLFKLKRVGGGEISPDGKWVAYTVSTTDLKEDRGDTQVWMIPLSGGEGMQMTSFKGASAGNPKWSPDGKYLSFTASRGEAAKSQVWTLNRQGGEAQQLTDVKQGIQDYEWSPDSTRLLLVIRDPSPEEMAQKEEAPRPAKRAQPPWVIDRLQFKRDFVGYLDRRRTHLHVFKVADKSMVQITSGDFDDSNPAWSPDGKYVAFVSNRSADPDNTFNSDIWVVAADNPDHGKTMLQLTTDPGSDGSPAWSPDGKWITYTTGHDDKLLYYAMNYLALVPAAGGKPEILTQKLDRSVNSPEFAPDGKSIYFQLEDSGERHLARINLATREITRPISGSRSVAGFRVSNDGTITARISERQLPGEIFVLDAGGKLRQLTTVNNALMAQLRLAEVEEIHPKSKDGTEIEGWLYKPPAFVPGMKYPLLLRIHGGPASQYEAAFSFEAELFAANGYVVVNMNPRGSTGYGQAFTTAIWADWGNKDYEDVIAGVEAAIQKGYADPERLGVGGWSYGGILTNYTITKTTRFKGAVSGASLGLVPAMYGHDHYQLHYEIELGLPWKNRAVWDKLSPFWNVEKITTPTLWICGEKDWNVPVHNSEQMYIGMKRLGRETQLVVYPGEFHGINKPTYQKDRYERYLGWYDKYVKGSTAAAPAQTTSGSEQ